MTQPVQEPGSTTRTDAKLTWGSNQLFRRPAPVSGEAEFKYIVCKDINVGQTLAPGNSSIVWQVNVEPNPECFTPELFGGSDYYQIRILEDGLYTVSCDIQLEDVASPDFDWSMSIYTVDAGTSPVFFRQNQGNLNGTQGWPSANIEWTFRMDGTGGSNRKIEFQFINHHATDDAFTQDVGGTYIELRKWPGTITMTGRDRNSDPG